MQPNLDTCAEQFAGTSDDAGWYPDNDDFAYKLNEYPSDSGVGGSSSSSETSSASKGGVVTPPEPDSASASPSNIPWASNRVYAHSVDGLHAEILECAGWLKSTPQEIYARVNVCHRVRTILHSFWRDSTLRVFGSVATDLFLPTSDIDLSVDLTIVNPETMRCAAKCFEESGDFDEVHVLDKAYVPIIKLRDRATGINIDISFNTQRAQEAVDYICHFRSLYPAMGPIAIFLKQFLMLRHLNHAFTGGLSSYGLVLMIAHLILRRYREAFYDVQVENLREGSLGQFLLDFLKYYGEEFDPVTEGLAFDTPMSSNVVPKAELVLHMREPLCASIFCLQDPLLPSNDVGRGAHQFMLVRSCFKAAYDHLLAVMDDDTFSDPILSTIMQFPPEIAAIRSRMHDSAVETWIKHNPGTPDFSDGLPLGPHPVFALADGSFYFPTMRCIINNMNYRGFNDTPEETIYDAAMQRQMLLQQMYENPSQYGIDMNFMNQMVQRFGNPNFQSPPPMQHPQPPQQQFFPPNFVAPQYWQPRAPFPPHMPIMHPHHPQAFLHQMPMPPMPPHMYNPHHPGRFQPDMVPIVPPPHVFFSYANPGFNPHQPVPGIPYGCPLPPNYCAPAPYSPHPRIPRDSESSTGSTSTPNAEDMACESDNSPPESLGSGTSDLSSISPDFDDESREALSSSPLSPGLSD
uniref:PAP-associated domain-containing protein n=1 Tax=Panagrellus redivivus TaxID=6233 RepID=A0A7E4VEW7_PANRE